MKLLLLVSLIIQVSMTSSYAFPDWFAAPYTRAVHRTRDMSSDEEVLKMASKMGLQVLDVTWEDTGRFKNSAVGPNISDMTIQVALEKGTGGLEVSCMPVVRHPNFEDKTCDLDPWLFSLMVGNHDGSPLRRVSLHEILANPLRYLSKPDSWRRKGNLPRTLLASRDSKVLVSAQACFLPVPKSGKATFNPVLFNYQSVKDDPGVLTILATREGTSITVIDNHRDAFSAGAAWGQRLFFNANGQRASLTGQRASEFAPDAGSSRRDDTTPQAASESGLNLVLLIQVPLKQKQKPHPQFVGGGMLPPAPVAAEAVSDVENAVIGHGDLEGPFTEVDNLAIERDTRFPVRVTVQFYKATSNGVVSEADLQAIKDQIDRVYADSQYVGSLVTEGVTGRATEHDGRKEEPAGWWKRFWRRQAENQRR